MRTSIARTSVVGTSAAGKLPAACQPSCEPPIRCEFPVIRETLGLLDTPGLPPRELPLSEGGSASGTKMCQQELPVIRETLGLLDTPGLPPRELPLSEGGSVSGTKVCHQRPVFLAELVGGLSDAAGGSSRPCLVGKGCGAIGRG